MTPEQRWRAAHRLYWTMRRHKAAFIHHQHPEWSETRASRRKSEIFSHARTWFDRSLFAQPLNLAGVRYLISGSVAAMLYGEPRVTHDIDLVVFLRVQDARRLGELFPAPAFYVPPVAAILEEMARERRGHFNIIHAESGLKADFYAAGRDELHWWAGRHARRYPVGANTISVAPAEYVILRKLEYHRDGGSEKHVRDIRAMLAISGDHLDRPALLEWVARLGLTTEWQTVAS